MQKLEEMRGLRRCRIEQVWVKRARFRGGRLVPRGRPLGAGGFKLRDMIKCGEISRKLRSSAAGRDEQAWLGQVGNLLHDGRRRRASGEIGRATWRERASRDSCGDDQVCKSSRKCEVYEGVELSKYGSKEHDSGGAAWCHGGGRSEPVVSNCAT